MVRRFRSREKFFTQNPDFPAAGVGLRKARYLGECEPDWKGDHSPTTLMP
jgi:hypothetical protein